MPFRATQNTTKKTTFCVPPYKHSNPLCFLLLCLCFCFCSLLFHVKHFALYPFMYVFSDPYIYCIKTVYLCTLQRYLTKVKNHYIKHLGRILCYKYLHMSNILTIFVKHSGECIDISIFIGTLKI